MILRPDPGLTRVKYFYPVINFDPVDPDHPGRIDNFIRRLHRRRRLSFILTQVIFFSFFSGFEGQGVPHAFSRDINDRFSRGPYPEPMTFPSPISEGFKINTGKTPCCYFPSVLQCEAPIQNCRASIKCVHQMQTVSTFGNPGSMSELIRSLLGFSCHSGGRGRGRREGIAGRKERASLDPARRRGHRWRPAGSNISEAQLRPRPALPISLTFSLIFG